VECVCSELRGGKRGSISYVHPHSREMNGRAKRCNGTDRRPFGLADHPRWYAGGKGRNVGENSDSQT
jgi:hypothetical protein